MVQPGFKLQCGARDIVLRGVINGDDDGLWKSKARLGHDAAIDSYGAPLDGVTGARTAGNEIAGEYKLVEAMSFLGHGLLMTGKTPASKLLFRNWPIPRVIGHAEY